MTRSTPLGIAVCTLALSGCVAPAPDDAAYESKALLTAQGALSAARAALLATRSSCSARESRRPPIGVDVRRSYDCELRSRRPRIPPSTVRLTPVHEPASGLAR